MKRYTAKVDERGRPAVEVDRQPVVLTLKEKYRQILTEEEESANFNPKRPWRQEMQPTGCCGYRSSPARIRDAPVAGVGVALLPNVLPEWSSMIATKPGGIFGVFPPHRMVPPKVRAFLDFARERFGKPPYWDPDWTEDRQKTSHDVTE